MRGIFPGKHNSIYTLGKPLKQHKLLLSIPALLSILWLSLLGVNLLQLPAEASSNLQRIAYYGNWDIYANDYTLKKVNDSGAASKLTTLVYSFENINPTSLQCFQDVHAVDTNESNPNAGDGGADAWADYQYPFPANRSVSSTADSPTQPLRGNFNQLKELKQKHPGLKIMLSIGGWTFSKYFSDAAQPANRSAFVSSCIDMYIRGNLPTNVAGDTTAGGSGVAAGIFDGIDLDWEFPGSANGHVGNHYSPSDTANYTALLAEFRSQLNAQGAADGKYYSLTAAVPSGESDMSLINVPAIAPYLDYADIMSYDMHGAWENHTNFNAPLYPSPNDPDASMGYTVDQAVTRWQNAGMPSSKIIVGMPFYWRGWSGVTAGSNNGLYQPASGGSPAFPITNQAGVGNYKELLAAGKLLGIHEDAASGGSPWVYDGSTFMTGDTPKSVSQKGNYIRIKGLAGAMVYALEGDDSSGTMLSAVVSGLKGSIVNFSPILAFLTLGSRTAASSPYTATASEPVNVVGGNFLSTRNEFELSNRDNPVDFTLSYNSALAGQASPVGMGWTHSYQITALPVDDSSGNVVVQNPDGRMDLYTPNGSGGFNAPQGIFDTLSLSGGTYQVIHKDHSTYNFNSDGQVSSVVSPNGSTQTMTYNAAGQLTTLTDSFNRSLTFAYDADTHLLLTVTDSTNRTVHYAYNDLGDLVQVTNPAGGITTYQYDGAHHLTKITDPRSHDVVINVYDDQGRVTQQTNGLGKTVTFTYDPANNKTTFTDANNHQTQYFYDSSLRITKITDALGHDAVTAYDTAGNPSQVTDANGHMTSYAYDSHGNVTQVTDPAGGVQSFTYDSNNNLLTRTDQNSHTTTYVYDSYGNVTQKTDPLSKHTIFGYDSHGQLVSITDALNNLTGFVYDAQGNVVTKTDPSNRNTYYGYDSIGRLTASETNNLHETDYTLDSMDRVTKSTDPSGHNTLFEYDADGNQTKITDANNHATSYQYDANNQLTKVTNPLGKDTTYSYDDAGNLTKKTDAKGHDTTYTYDALNRQTQTTDSLGNVTTVAYDAAGNIISRTDASNRVTTYTYDSLNRLTTITYPNATTATYTYDPAGNVLAATNSAGTTTYTYDANNHIATVTDPHNSTITYHYNAIGSLDHMTYPDGKVVDYTYTPSNQLSTVTDWNNKTTTYLYDNDAQLAVKTYPNTIKGTYTYDVNGNLSSLAYKKGTTPFTTYNYTRDNVGNVTEEEEAKANGTFLYHDYTYDTANQVTLDDAPADTYTYTYDDVGNVATSTNGNTGTSVYTYNNANRLTAKTNTTRTLTYDNQGNEITDTGKTLGYNYDNQLTSYVTGSLTTNYIYDAAGNRIDKTQTGSGAVNYRYVNAGNNNVLTAKNMSTSAINYYVYGLDMISQGAASTTSRQYYLPDGNGTIRYVTDGSGNTVSNGTLSYDTYGKQVGGSTSLTNYGFQSEQKDPESNLIYLRARYYDPTLERFTSQDPFSGQLGLPASQNGYNYANDDPVNLSDPSGMNVMLGTAGGGNNCSWGDNIAGYSQPNALLGLMHWLSGSGSALTMQSNNIQWNLNVADLEKLKPLVGKQSGVSVGASADGLNAFEAVGRVGGTFYGDILKTATGYRAIGVYAPTNDSYDFNDDATRGGPANLATAIGRDVIGKLNHKDYPLNLVGTTRVDQSW